jgi:hypothetical protein
MLSFRGRIGAFGAGAMIMFSGTVQAAPSCWTAQDVRAAQVREMQTVLMVAALRCRAAGIDISAAYDGFVGAQRGVLSAANLVIKEHFAMHGGAQADYDRFTTALANGHGDDETTQATCGEAVSLARDAAAASGETLQQIATERVFPVALPGGACGVPEGVTPVATPEDKARRLPPIVMASAPPAEPKPVTLSPDVVAALAVLARYQSGIAAPAAKPTQIAAIAS